MNTVRPLVTISIIVVVGAFLYAKINEGPVRYAPGANDPWSDEAPEGVPPLAAAASAQPPSETPAPPWSTDTAATSLSTDSTDPAIETPNSEQMSAQSPAVPAVPAIPAIPEVAALQPQSAVPGAPAPPLPAGLPANIPTARYPDQPNAANIITPDTRQNNKSIDQDVVQSDVRRMVAALYEGDTDTILQYTYPNLIEAMGGSAQAKSVLDALSAQTKAAGMVLKSFAFPEDPKTFSTDSHEFVVVPTMTIVAANGKRVESLNFQLGVRDIGAVDWKYLEGSRINKENVRAFFPDFPADYEFPPFYRKEFAVAPSVDASSVMAGTTPATNEGGTSSPTMTQQNPVRQPSLLTEDDRYAAGVNPADTPSVETPAAALQPAAAVQASFATSWPEIQAALDRGELARAHELLSQWYDDPTLTPTDAELVDTLLSQLAGTVVYSTRHELEPPYVVKPGETLETIAQEYNVPWQLLAKINDIAGADQVQPGQQLKVVRGPFSAVVDVDSKSITLMLDDRYAGKFPITVPSVSAVTDGQWVVDKKPLIDMPAIAQTAYGPAPTIDRTIVLRGDSSTGADKTLSIASDESSTAAKAAIRVTPQDAEDLSDILSIGSRVIIRR